MDYIYNIKHNITHNCKSQNERFTFERAYAIFKAFGQIGIPTVFG